MPVIPYTFKSIRARLTLWFLLIAMVPMVTASLIVYYQTARSARTRGFDKLEAIRDLKTDQINFWLNERISDIKNLSENYEIEYAANVFTRPERTENDMNIIRNTEVILSDYIKNYIDYSEIFIINISSGIVEISADKLSEGQDMSGKAYFTAPARTGEIYITEIYYSQNINKPTMTLSVPIYSLFHEEVVTGILAICIDLEKSLYDLLLLRTGLGKTGETLIVNKNGLALSELRWHSHAPLSFSISAKPAVMSSHGNTGITETTDYRGEKVLAAYTYIPSTRWGFIAKQDIKEIYEPVEIMMQELFFLLPLLILGVYLIAVISGRKIAQPITEMADVSKRIQQGELSARNTLQKADELAFLAKSFNDMADSITFQMAVQSGVASITELLVSASELEDMGRLLLKKLTDITESDFGTYYVLNRVSDMFEHIYSNPDPAEPFDQSVFEGEFENFLTGNISHIKNIPENTACKLKAFTGLIAPKELITVPLMADSKVHAMIILANLNNYSKESLAILYQTRLIINTAVSKLLANAEINELAKELRLKNTELEIQSQELEIQAEVLKRISERLQEKNMKLEAQKDKIAETSRLKSEFLSNISHELRTPLNSVMSLSRALIMQAKEKLSSEENNYLEIIERNGSQLLCLINDILDLSKMEAGKTDLNTELFSVKEPVEMIVENLEPLAREKGVEISFRADTPLPQVKSDKTKMYKVLENIVGNAVKFTDKGSVTVSAFSDPDNIYIRVADTGIGIPEKELPFIFEEFRQVDGSSSSRFEGTGLGLTIAFKTAKILGGKISVQSTVGKGTVFTLTLPINNGEL